MKLLHKLPGGLFPRSGKFYLRRRVPADICVAMGRAEVWKSLRTDSLKVALRRFPFAASNVESDFAKARLDAGTDIDLALLKLPDGGHTVFRPINEDASNSVAAFAPTIGAGSLPVGHPKAGTTFADAYYRYINYPTQSCSERTCETYETCRKVAVAVLGADTPIDGVTTAHIRDFIEVLR